MQFRQLNQNGRSSVASEKEGRERRKGPERGLSAGAGGSDKWPEKPRFCGVPAAPNGRIKNVPNGETGGGEGIRSIGTDLVRHAGELHPACSIFRPCAVWPVFHLPGTRSMPDRRAPGPCNQLQRASAEFFPSRSGERLRAFSTLSPSVAKSGTRLFPQKLRVGIQIAMPRLRQ
jgi:hypothetical protein